MRRFTPSESLAARLNLLPTAIYDTFPAVLFGRTLLLATRIGIFDLLAGQPATEAEIAAQFSLHPEGAALLMKALLAAGYVRQNRNRYTLTAQAKKWLVRTSPHSIVNFLLYIELLYTHWVSLEESLRKGSPAKSYVETFTNDEWRIYMLGMRDLANLILPYVIPLLKVRPDMRDLLDIGGSHGLYSTELCNRHPRLSATIADLPPVVQQARTIFAGSPVRGQIRFEECDILSVPFSPESYDLMLAFNIIHGFPLEVNRNLITHFFRTLRPGGRLYLLDQLREKKGNGVKHMLPIIVGLNLLNEIGGRSFTVDEITGLCRQVGFRKVEWTRLRLPGVHLVIAEKD